MKLASLLIGLALIMLVGLWYFAGRKTFYINPSRGEAVIAFGDSLMVGVGSTPRNDLVSLLSQRLNVPIINAGRSGDTTQDALARLTSDVSSNNPRVVLVLLGGNDVLRHIPKEVTFANLGTIIDRIHAQGAAVILIGVRGKLLLDDYQKEFKKLARTKQVRYIPDVLKGIFGNPSLMSDEIHPNDKGYMQIAERVEPVLRDVLD